MLSGKPPTVGRILLTKYFIHTDSHLLSHSRYLPIPLLVHLPIHSFVNVWIQYSCPPNNWHNILLPN